MSSKKRKRSGNKLPPFVPLPWGLLNGPAYKALTPSASKALPYFLGKVKVTYDSPEKYITNFSFSYKEADRYGFCTGTFHRTICRLVEKGFIDPVSKGGLRGDGHSLNLFKLSNRWEEYGTEDFKAPSWEEFGTALKAVDTKARLNRVYDKEESDLSGYVAFVQSLTINVNSNKNGDAKDDVIEIEKVDDKRDD